MEIHDGNAKRHASGKRQIPKSIYVLNRRSDKEGEARDYYGRECWRALRLILVRLIQVRFYMFAGTLVRETGGGVARDTTPWACAMLRWKDPIFWKPLVVS